MTQTPESSSVRGTAEALHVGRPNMGSRDLFQSYLDGMWERRWLSNSGPLVVELEARLADYLKVPHVVTMTNGTVALEIAIRALGLTGEVIVPAFTFVATAHALSWQGLTPVFADIDESSHNLDPESVEKMITPITSGIIGVHLWGRPAPVQALEEIAVEHGLSLLFDAAHAFGTTHNGQPLGSFGRAEVFSFHATKFFNTFEGGAVATADEDLANQMRLMRNFGFDGYDNVIYPGTNGKMTEICAAMGLTNLESVSQFVEINRCNYRLYRDLLAQTATVRILKYDERERCNYQYVVLEVADDRPGLRDRLISRLHSENVLARRYFWPGVHRMQPYRSLYPHAGLLLPATRRVADRVIVLPTGAAVSEPDVRRICAVILDEIKE